MLARLRLPDGGQHAPRLRPLLPTLLRTGFIQRPFERLLALNRQWSDRLEARLPHAVDLHALWTERVSELLNARPGQLVVDAGGGRTCSFAAYRKAADTHIVAVDISDEEMRENTDVDEKRVANVVEDLPFESGEVDLLVSRSTVEHLPDVAAFMRNCRRVMKDAGYVVHDLPCKRAPFALANRLLPQRLTAALLRVFMPWSEGILGFPAYYDHCTPAAMVRLAEESGFEVEEVLVSYYQARYFDFLFPLFALNVGYELIVRALRMRELCACFVIVARAVPASGTPDA
jgi:ubiquinone/menaquinone biosynthesis C-methylase UbiE